MEINEALDQIGFLRQIAERSRIRFAHGYRHLIMWGTIWVVGYGTGPWLPMAWHGWNWLVLTLIGCAGGAYIGKMEKRSEPTPLLLKQVGLASLLLLVSSIVMLLAFCKTNPTVDKAYFPFITGTIYSMTGLFMGSEAVALGVWLMVASLISMALPAPIQDLWLAIVGGGTLIVSGLLMRRQVKRG